MFDFDIAENLQKKLKKIKQKDKVLAGIFKKKILEVIQHNKTTIDTYKNLKSPMHEFKRIHLTDNYILLFIVTKKKNHILFIDIVHRDIAYKKRTA